jgi:hypothetical protein
MENLELEIDQSLSIIEGGIDWTTFFNEYWLKKPVLYRCPFEKPIMDQDTVLKVLKKYRADLANNLKRHIIIYDKNRVPKNGILTSKRNSLGVDKLLPKELHADFEQYVNELSEIENYEEFCIYIQDANTDDAVWKITRSFLQKIVQHIPLSPDKVTCDFFIGNYTKTNFGAHKDPVDNMMFMLFGKRTMLMWDDHTWKNKLGNPNDDKHIVLDYDAFRSSALSCTLEPGDFLYWPASHWHVGENGRQLSASFNIDFLRTDQDILSDFIIKETLTESVKRIGKELYKHHGLMSEKHSGQKTHLELPASYQQLMARMLMTLSDKKLDKELTSWWLKKNSSYGQLTAPGKRKMSITNSTALSFDRCYPVLYAIVDDTILISHSGHVLFISSHAQAFKSVIDKLNTVSKFTPASFFDALDIPGVTIDTIVNLLGELYSIHAVDIDE